MLTLVCMCVCVYTTHVLVELVKDRSPRLGCFQMCMCVCVCVCVCACVCMCVAIWRSGESHVMKNHDFSMPSIYTFTRSFKKTHSGGGFFWRGFLVVLRKLRKLLSNFHHKFAILEKPRFLLASVNGTNVSLFVANSDRCDVVCKVYHKLGGMPLLECSNMHVASSQVWCFIDSSFRNLFEGIILYSFVMCWTNSDFINTKLLGFAYEKHSKMGLGPEDRKILYSSSLKVIALIIVLIPTGFGMKFVNVWPLL